MHDNAGKNEGILTMTLSLSLVEVLRFGGEGEVSETPGLEGCCPPLTERCRTQLTNTALEVPEAYFESLRQGSQKPTQAWAGVSTCQEKWM